MAYSISKGAIGIHQGDKVYGMGKKMGTSHNGKV